MAMPQPINDDIDDAIVISGDGFTYSGSTAGATGETGEPEPYYADLPLTSVWFVYTTTAGGETSFDVTTSSSYSIAFYRSNDGSDAFSSFSVQSSGTSWGGGTSGSYIYPAIGDTYYVQITGVNVDYTITQTSGSAGLNPSWLYGTSSADTLGTLLDGAKTMLGGLDDDIYYIDSADDVVTENAGEGYDTLYTLVDYTLPANVERVIALVNTGVTLTGNELDNSLIGGSGGDVLYGLDGDDTLNGRGGVDTMVGGLGDDSYIVNKSSDVVLELAGEGVDTVYTSVGYRLSDNVENIVIRSDDGLSVKGNALGNAMIGGAGADTLFGYDGDDRLDGRGGADRMVGGSGDDAYTVDNAGDVVIENADDGYDTVYSTIDYALTDNVEKLVGRGSVGLTLTGNALDNLISGGSGADRLSGGDGADRISGGAGDDILIGGAGKDVLIGGAGADTFVFTSLSDLRDTITDFEVGVDKIGIDIGGFGLTTLAADMFVSNADGLAASAETRFIYNETKGALYFDADGDGAGKAIQIASLRGAPALSFADLSIFGLDG